MKRAAPFPVYMAHRAPLAFVIALALVTAGCQTPVSSLNVASTPAPPPPGDDAPLRAYATDMASRYAAHPADKAIAINYAVALRRLTQNAQAVAILQKLAVQNPHDSYVLANYGKALADAGRLEEASTVLANAHTPERPNWSVLSAQGSVADQMNDHVKAQAYYSAALKIVPNQPQVLSNLGLSYALERQMPQAESTLRQASLQPGADMRVRQNLALVLSLEGKYAEAEDISRRDLAAIDAAENVSSIKQMIAHSDTWRQAQTKSRRVAARRDDFRQQTATIIDPQQ